MFANLLDELSIIPRYVFRTKIEPGAKLVELHSSIIE